MKIDTLRGPLLVCNMKEETMGSFRGPGTAVVAQETMLKDKP